MSPFSSIVRRVTLSAAAIAALLVIPLEAQAQITVVSVQADTISGTLTVNGSPLAAGLRVFLFANGVTELGGVSVNGSRATAMLPAGISAGTYLLAVYQPSTNQAGTFPATIAAPAPRVVDAHGRVVGPLVQPNAVALRDGPDTFCVMVMSGGFVSNAAGSFFFLQPDCSGQRYLFFQSPTTRALPMLGLVDGAGPTGTAAYIPDYSQTPVTTPGPLYSVGNSKLGDGCMQSLPAGSYQLQPVRSVDLSLFATPFSVQVP